MNYDNKGLGAVLNPEDPRDIPLALVQAPVALPRKFTTDLSDFPVEDQKKNGSCVGQAEGKCVEYFDKKETKALTKISNRFVYGECKKLDGIPHLEGTYPRIAAKVLMETGACREDLINDDDSLPHAEYIKYDVNEAITLDAYLRRVGGYAFVAPIANDIMQAIYQNGVVGATMNVGDWGDLPVKPTPYRGRHRILLFGFEQRKNKGKDDVRFYFRNSWGKNWGDDGNGYFWYSDYKDHLFDIMAYTDIPNEILEERKESNYAFTYDLDRGATGPVVLELQRRLKEEPAQDGLPCFRGGDFAPIFGPLTEAAVQRYQCANGLVCSGTPTTTGYGRLGPKTRASLNSKKKAKSDSTLG